MAYAFLVPRDESGAPIPQVTGARPVTPRELHEYRMFLLGIRDPETVQRLWEEEQELLKQVLPKTRRRR